MGSVGGVNVDPPPPRLQTPYVPAKSVRPIAPSLSSSAQVQCDSYRARELAAAAAVAAAASASAQKAPCPRYIPGEVRAGAELHRDFLLAVHPEKEKEKRKGKGAAAAREQPDPMGRGSI